jgi:hypothetical protein
MLEGGNTVPLLVFKCEACSNEFEKIMPAHKELHKWCKHCDKLTIWVETIGQKVCSICMGNEHLAPMSTDSSLDVEKGIQEICPACGKLANHVLRIEKRGFHKGAGATANDSSVSFRFNYLANDV